MPELGNFQTYGYPPGSAQWEILRALWHLGGLTSATCAEHGFTRNGLPCEALRELITKRIVAPRVLTSQPLRVVWQLREQAHCRITEARIGAEASRLKLKEYAPGGFALSLRKELRR